MFDQLQGIWDVLLKRIKDHGSISFRDFMEICLYEKKFGYYSQEQIRIGKDGDFVTAPHTTKLFGYLLSVQIKEFFNILKNSSDFSICEFGAGTGFLASDILEFFLKFYPNIYTRLKYIIIEPIPKRKQILKEFLIDYQGHYTIIEDFAKIDDFKGVIVANELFDAFPVHLVEKIGQEFFEIFVGLNEEGKLIEKRKKISNKELKKYIDKYLKKLPDNYRTEINLDMKKWIKSISYSFKKGFCLIIDYGYPRNDYFADFRNRGTLLGYTKQNVTEDFFRYPGMVDITAHVNFSDAVEWFQEAGFRCEGFCPQWAFLGGLDIEETLEKAFGRLEPFSPALAGVKSLIFPQGMGETHKVLVVSKNIEPRPELKGFRMKNDLARLI